MSASRQLAAIMFTDIVGYTRLMGKNEQAAFDLLKKNWALQRPLVEQFKGNWLKEMGDGVLASFKSVSDAVYCAKSIQEACLNEKDLSLRIGIHLGEVVFEEQDVFGDGVNIASRLEPLAQPGGILISEAVQRNLLNKEDIETVFFKKLALKNVQHPINSYLVKVEGIELDIPDTGTQKSKRPVIKAAYVILMVAILAILAFLFLPNFNIAEDPVDLSSSYDKSIAVLPFVNMSNDPDQQYFSDGITVEILNHLVKVGELKVTSRTSVMQYQGTEKTITTIAKDLGVAHILDGSVQKDGDHIRINVQLIDALTDQQLWSETYDREFTDIFAIQSEVAQQVTMALNAQLQPQVIRSMDQVPTQNMEAYELYLKSLGSFQNITATDEQGVLVRKWMHEAIALDSGFSTAYAVLGNNIIFQAGFAGNDNAVEMAAQAKSALEKSLLLNPLDGIAHGMMGAYLLWFERDFRRAEIEQLSAQKLAPSDERSYAFMVDLLMAQDRSSEAVQAGYRLLELAPTPVSWARMALIQAFNNNSIDMDHAIEQAKQAESANVLAFTEIARAYLIQRKYGAITEVLDLSPDSKTIPRGMSLLAIAYSKLGQDQNSKHWFNILHQRSQQNTGGSPAFYMAMVHASMGEVDKAFQWLETSLEDNEIELYWLKVEPEFSSLHQDSRWQDMLDRVGFP